MLAAGGKEMNVAFSLPDIGEEEIKEVTDTLRSGWITTGPKTKEFERRIAEFTNTSKAVCLNSSTACLEMTLRILGVGPGDEVITTAYTYTASASIICHVGAAPILVDTAEGSYEMDYDKLEKVITPKTKVIIPVDLAGKMCDYDRIFNIVERKKNLFKPSNHIQRVFNRIIILADSAHAFGAVYHNKRCGSVADFTSFSFHAVKNLTTAEGGAVVWKDKEGIDNEELYKQYMLLTLHGQSKDALEKNELGDWEYDIIAPYYKCNMTDITAALGVAQLRRYPQLLERRKEIIERYNKALSCENVKVLDHYGKEYSSSGHLYLVRLLGKDRKYTNYIIKRMAEEGVATNVHYKPLPMHTAYKNLGFDIKDYPNAFNMYANEITLPLHTCLTDEQVEYVIETFKKVLHE
jgi:dTDP-4-amino-4,6-dideoxygalactose transaminase